MIDLPYLQKERKRLYKNDLKREFQQRQQLKKNSSMEIKCRQKQLIAHKIETINNQLQEQKIKDMNIKNQIRSENQYLSMIKNQVNLYEEERLNSVPLKGNSMIDKLYNEQYNRSQKARQTYKKNHEMNHSEEYIHKTHEKSLKCNNKTQQIRHMQRIHQLQTLRRQENEAIKLKHSTKDPRMFEIHRSLQQINEEYKKSLQKFAYNGKDILDSLKRNDSSILYQKRKSMNNELMQQMEDKKIKNQIQKNIATETEDLKNSFLSNVLFKNENRDKKSYADFLKRQINLTDMRKSQQKHQQKQKFQISSIFGGEEGPERVKMMKYIDKNLGIESEMLKRVDACDRMSSQFRIKNLYQQNGQQLSNNIIMDKSYTFNNQAQLNNYQMNPQSNNISSSKQFNNKYGNNSVTQNVEKSSQNSKILAPKSYMSYDFIQGLPRRYEY